MSRSSEVQFGSLSRVVGAAVYANAWWIMRAEGVELAGDTPTWHQLVITTHVPGHATATPRHGPERINANWVRAVMPIGLQMGELVASPLDLGLVACRVEERPSGSIDLAYPFLLTELGDEVVVGFSELGPPDSIRDDIIRALVLRLLMGAVEPPPTVV